MRGSRLSSGRFAARFVFFTFVGRQYFSGNEREMTQIAVVLFGTSCLILCRIDSCSSGSSIRSARDSQKHSPNEEREEAEQQRIVNKITPTSQRASETQGVLMTRERGSEISRAQLAALETSELVTRTASIQSPRATSLRFLRYFRVARTYLSLSQRALRCCFRLPARSPRPERNVSGASSVDGVHIDASDVGAPKWANRTRARSPRGNGTPARQRRIESSSQSMSSAVIERAPRRHAAKRLPRAKRSAFWPVSRAENHRK